MAARLTYGGNPEHKRAPGAYGLALPPSPRPGKTLCDAERPILKTEALDLVRAGMLKGTVSVSVTGLWPQNVWSVSPRGEAFEAQLENATLGTYHGYPMPMDDDFRRVVEREWLER